MGLYRKKDSPFYWMSFSFNGRQFQRSTGTADKRLAEGILAKVRTQIIEGKWFEIDESKTRTFDELMEKFMEEHAPKRRAATQKNYQNYRKIALSYFSGMTLAEITPRLLSDFKQKRREAGLAPATINRELAFLSKAFNLAWKQWEWVRENPCQKVEREQENNTIDRWLQPEEERRLMQAAEGYLNGQMKEIIAVALHTGMRQGEILNLKWNDIDLFRKTLTVLKTKNNHPKTLPLNDTLFELLLSKSKVRSMAGYVFVTENDTKIRARNVMREWYKILHKAGIKDFRFHDCRHTFATRLVQQGVDLYTVSKLLGHRDISTTQRYSHHCPESLRAAVKVLDNSRGSVVKNETVQG